VTAYTVLAQRHTVKNASLTQVEIKQGAVITLQNDGSVLVSKSLYPTLQYFVQT